MNEKILQCMRWAIYMEIPTLVVGVFLFWGSIHSGGPTFYASTILVPPLLLDVYGYLPKSSLSLWVMVVAFLQYLICLLVSFVLVSLRNRSQSDREKSNSDRDLLSK
jgi:hypothetical protein